MAPSVDQLSVVTFNMCSPPLLALDKGGLNLTRFETVCAATGAVACEVFLNEGRESNGGYTEVLIGPKENQKSCLLRHDPTKTGRVIDYVKTLAQTNDVVCLQEVNPEYKSALETFCNENGFGIHFKMQNGNKHGTAVIYKTTALSNVVHSEHKIHTKDALGNITKTRFVTEIEGCTTTGKTVRIASAHFFGFENRAEDEEAIKRIMNNRKSFALMTIFEKVCWFFSCLFSSLKPKPDLTIIGADTNVPQYRHSGSEDFHRVDVPEGSMGGLHVDVNSLSLNPAMPLGRIAKGHSESVCALLVSPSSEKLPLAKKPEDIGCTVEANLSDHAVVAAAFSI